MQLTDDLMRFMQENNMPLIAPEIILVLFILVSVYRLAVSKTLAERQEIWGYSLLGLVMTLLMLGIHWNLGYVSDPRYLSFDVFGGLFTGDLFSLLIRTLLVIGTLMVLLFTRAYVDKKAEVPGEYYVLLLSALLGGMMLSGAKDLIMVFVSLETLSISSYILVGYLRGNVLSAEAGLKYLLYGGMATAILLFGFSILYGLTGSLDFSVMASHLGAAATHVNPLVIAIMLATIVGGISFKLSAAPFHMWAPDTYQGAPTPVVAFLSVVSKIAAFAFAIRLFSSVFAHLPSLSGLMIVLSVLSMVIGNVVALAQKDIKRLLAYSTVAHVGYLLLGFVVMSPAGLSSIIYYLITYLFMNLGAFAVVTHFENETGRVDIAAYAGLVRKRPGITFILSIMLLSLAGIPITAGFFGKFFLFQAVANAGSQYLWLVVVALLTSTISLYYYLNVIRLMVIAEPSDAVDALPAEEADKRSFSQVSFVFALSLVATLGLGLFAEPMMAFSGKAIQAMTADSAVNASANSHPVKVMMIRPGGR
jgi:NAD(P)H-quinone oxidoreductase subunit 2